MRGRRGEGGREGGRESVQPQLVSHAAQHDLVFLGQSMCTHDTCTRIPCTC